MQKQNLSPKKNDRFWGKFKPTCQLIKEKEERRKGFTESNIKYKKVKTQLLNKKTKSIKSNLISHITQIKSIIKKLV